MARAPRRSSPPKDESDVVGGNPDDLQAMLEQLGALGQDASELTDVVDLTPTGEWIKNSGRTPIEFLTLVYRHPLVAMKDRISAAGRVMDFVHRKMPAAIEVGNPDGSALRLDSGMLSRLSAKELDALEKLLTKAQGEKA